MASDLIIGDDGLARPRWASADPLLRDYYDHEWGVPVRDERGIYERLTLEAFQPGLSWATVALRGHGPGGGGLAEVVWFTVEGARGSSMPRDAGLARLTSDLR